MAVFGYDDQRRKVKVLGQPNHAHRKHDPAARSREGSLISYVVGALVAGAVLFGVYLLLRGYLL